MNVSESGSQTVTQSYKFQIARNFEYKIDNNSKTKNRTNKTHELKNPFQNIAHLLDEKSQLNGPYLSDNISKTKNEKLISQLFQNIGQHFRPKNKNGSF